MIRFDSIRSNGKGSEIEIQLRFDGRRKAESLDANQLEVAREFADV